MKPENYPCEPAHLWDHFYRITQIPRPSKSEAEVRQYVINCAKDSGCEWVTDFEGNLIVRVPGTKNRENKDALIIQNHLDMVTVKQSDKQHDFENDPLNLKVTDGWLHADRTTLGADNGIGVAAAMALLDLPENTPLPPLECLFTVDEETGLTGAFALNGEILKGRTMLNLDTEDWGEICIGCAGGGDSSINLPVNYVEAPADYLSFQLSVEGLKGGHSGVDIHEERGNAIVFISSIIDDILEHAKITITSLEGGDKHNAIPREAFAQLYIHPESVSDAQNSVANIARALRNEFGTMEPNFDIKFTGSSELPDKCLSDSSQMELIGLLRTLPHGVLKYSHDVQGLVETSNNLASVKKINDKINIVCSTRSSISEALESQRKRIKIMSEAFGAVAEQDKAYPGWAPNINSPVLETTTKIYTELLGKDPHICAIHAGLECGVIGEKVKGMDKSMSVFLQAMIRKYGLPSRVKKPRSSPYFTDFEVFKSIRNDYVNKKYDERNKDEKTAGKRMQMLIKDYLNGIERILKKHAKGVQEALTGYLKRKTTNRNWDEIIVDDVNITRIFIVSDHEETKIFKKDQLCLLYTSPSPRDLSTSRMPSSA